MRTCSIEGSIVLVRRLDVSLQCCLVSIRIETNLVIQSSQYFPDGGIVAIRLVIVVRMVLWYPEISVEF